MNIGNDDTKLIEYPGSWCPFRYKLYNFPFCGLLKIMANLKKIFRDCKTVANTTDFTYSQGQRK